MQVWIGNETFDTIQAGILFQESGGGRAGGPDIPTFGATTTPGFSIHFDLGTTRFRLFQGGEDNPCGGGSGLRRDRGGGYSVYCGGLEFETASEGKAVTVVLPREILLNETGTPFGPGQDITNFYATSVTPVVDAPAGGTYARDRAPDEGFGPDYHSALGEETGSGLFQLTSVQPIRVSNGESTTIVYPVELNNTGSSERTVVLSIENPQSEWTVRSPARLIAPPTSTTRFPVILSMPFHHEHGTLATFLVRAEDALDPSQWAGMRLGVFWLDTPQPAGHHNTLWLHSSGGFHAYSSSLGQCQTTDAWMNPLPEEVPGRASEADVAGCPFEDASPSGQTTYPANQTYEWRVPLDPELAMGLDFDVDQTGSFVADLRTKTPSNRAVVAFSLLYCDPSRDDGASVRFGGCGGTWTTLAWDQYGPTSLPANTLTRLEFEFPLRAEADLIPYQRGSNLMLYVRFNTEPPAGPPNTATPESAPLLVVKGAELVLPLVEYHDPIDQAFQDVGLLELRPLGPFEKPVNPGRTAVFPFELANVASQRQEVEITIEGHNHGWATLFGGDRFDLEPLEKANITLAVVVPVDASEGERAELFVVGQSRTDPNVVALSRLRAAVVDAVILDVPDEADQVPSERGAAVPALHFAFVATAMSAVMFLRRKHS